MAARHFAAAKIFAIAGFFGGFQWVHGTKSLFFGNLRSRYLRFPDNNYLQKDSVFVVNFRCQNVDV